MLSYEIVETNRDSSAVRFKAKPNEWACSVTGEIELADWGIRPRSHFPRVANIGWSSGCREWTTDEARAFFRAGLDLMDRLDAELAKAKEVANVPNR